MPVIPSKECGANVPKLGHQDCGDASKTPLIATQMGSISQPKPYCLTWVCQNSDCRRKKADSYIQGEKIGKLRWIGWIPDKNYRAVRDARDRMNAYTFTITFNVGDRLIASDHNLTPRSELMMQLSNIRVLERLAHQMIHGDVKAVSPAPPKRSKGGKLLGTGEAWPQYRIVERSGFRLKVGEIGDALYERKQDDPWSQEEVVIFIGGQLDTVKLVDR